MMRARAVFTESVFYCDSVKRFRELPQWTTIHDIQQGHWISLFVDQQTLLCCIYSYYHLILLLSVPTCLQFSLLIYKAEYSLNCSVLWVLTLRENGFSKTRTTSRMIISEKITTLNCKGTSHCVFFLLNYTASLHTKKHKSTRDQRLMLSTGWDGNINGVSLSWGQA